MELRDYQTRCIESVISAVKQGINKQVIVMATGTGKTIVFNQLPSKVKAKSGKKTLILAHREELLDQAKDKLLMIDPSLTVGIEQGDRACNNDVDVVIASVPTLGRNGSKRIEKFNPDDFGLVIIDECHHATAKTYQNILRYFRLLKGESDVANSGRVLLGVTATPNRSDHQGLDKIFDKITFSYTLRQGIADKYLANISAYTVETESDISHVKTARGDFSDKELADAINNDARNKLIVDSYLDIAPKTKALAFATNVEHVEDLTLYFQSAGIKADYVIGATPKDDRRRILKEFSNGDIDVLVNCAVLTEGFDETSIETILMARPTKSSVAYAQMIGRGTRLHPGKEHLKLIDFVDNTGKNQVAGLPNLFGLPNLKGRKGKLITKLVEQAEKILEVNPEHDLEAIEDWSDEEINKIVKRVDIFAQAQLPDEVKQYSQLSWVIHRGGYRLQFPIREVNGVSVKDQIVLQKNMLDHYEIKIQSFHSCKPSFFNNYSKWQKSKVEENIGEFKDVKDAFRIADNWVHTNRSEFRAMFNQDSKWRKDKPSEKQLKMLKKFKIPVPPGLTKGQASILLGKAFENRGSKRH